MFRDQSDPGPDEHVLSASAVTRKGRGYISGVARGIYLAGCRWNQDDAGGMAASVAYYLALSLFPMLLVLTAGVGMVMRFTTIGHDAELQILSVVKEHCSESLEAQVRSVLNQLQTHSMVGGPFGLATALMAAIGVFYQFERAFDRIWRIPPKRHDAWLKICQRVLVERFSAFCLLAGLGFAIVLIMATNMALSAIANWMHSMKLPGTSLLSLAEASATIVLNAVVFGMLFRFLPKRPVRWHNALRGGMLAALVWEFGRQLLNTTLIGMKYTTAYGAIGSFIALLLWCYWGVSIIFFGAEYVQVLSENDQLRKSNGTNNPESDIIRISPPRNHSELQELSQQTDSRKKIVPRRIAA